MVTPMSISYRCNTAIRAAVVKRIVGSFSGRKLARFRKASSGRVATSAGPAETLEKRIDYVFLVPGMAHSAEVVNSQRVLDRPFRTPDGWLWASDHAGLLTVIQLER